MKKINLALTLVSTLFFIHSISGESNIKDQELVLAKTETPKANFAITKIPNEQNNQITIKDVNKKLQFLSTQLKKIMPKIKNVKEKKVLIQLIQNIKNGKSCQCTSENTASKENNKNVSLRRDIFDVIKNLTSPSAIIAYAIVICFAITKGILDSGQLVNVLHSLQAVLDQVVSYERLKLIGHAASYIVQGIFYYFSFGYAGKAF